MSRIPSDILRYVELAAEAVRQSEFSDVEREVLERINRRIGARASLDELLAFVADALRPISPCDRFSLAFVEEDGRRVVSKYTHAFYEPVILKPGYTEDLAAGSLADVLERGVPRIINDLPAYLALRPKSRSTNALVKEGVRASLTCPLFVDDRVVGLLFRSSRQAGVYDEHQARLHLAIAERLSQTVEKAYRIAQLAEANRAYFEMLGFVTHELKSPVSSMLTEAGLLRDGYVGELTPAQQERLDKLIAKGKYLLGLAGDYLELSRLEGGQMKLAARADVDLVADVLEPAVEIVTAQLEARSMRLEREIPPDVPPVELDPQLVKIICVNLLSNAVKYGREGGLVRLRAAFDAGRLTVAVWNEGVGFAAEQRGRLFRRFSRLPAPELLKQKGTGVGLYTSWRIVQLHGGRIDARSEPGAWAEFWFELPQPLVRGGTTEA